MLTARDSNEPVFGEGKGSAPAAASGCLDAKLKSAQSGICGKDELQFLLAPPALGLFLPHLRAYHTTVLLIPHEHVKNISGGEAAWIQFLLGSITPPTRSLAKPTYNSATYLTCNTSSVSSVRDSINGASFGQSRFLGLT
jgi:hypothetical protein